MAGILDSIKNGISGGQSFATSAGATLKKAYGDLTTFTGSPSKIAVTDNRDPNRTRPRVEATDPSKKIDAVKKTSILSFPTDRPKYYMSFGFEEYRRPSMFEGATSAGITDYIALPMPGNLKDTSQLVYKMEDGNFITDAMASTVNGMIDGYKTGGVGSLKDNLGSILTKSGDALLGGGARKVLTGIIGDSSTITGGIQQSLGIADNPFMTIAFQGAQFKTHNFGWRLYPRNAGEAEAIQNIVNTFKRVSHPELLAASFGGFYKYPHIVHPKFNPTETADAMYRFKPCVITRVDLDWAPNAGRPGFFYDGKPIEVVLSLDLQEIELWRGGDGNDNGLLSTVKNGDFNNIPKPPVRNLGPV
jgi:hypothetical protein